MVQGGQERGDVRVVGEFAFEPGHERVAIQVLGLRLVGGAGVALEVALAVPGDVDVGTPVEAVGVLGQRVVDGVACDERGGRDEGRQREPGDHEDDGHEDVPAEVAPRAARTPDKPKPERKRATRSNGSDDDGGGTLSSDYVRMYLKEIGRVSGEVVAEVGATDPLTQKIYDSYMDFRAKSVGWAEISDQGYYNARSLPFQYG